PGPVDLREVSFKELVVRGVRVYTTDDVRRAIELVADGSLGLDRLPTRAFRLEDTSQAFAAAGAADHLQVLVASHDEDADAWTPSTWPAPRASVTVAAAGWGLATSGPLFRRGPTASVPPGGGWPTNLPPSRARKGRPRTGCRWTSPTPARST